MSGAISYKSSHFRGDNADEGKHMGNVSADQQDFKFELFDEMKAASEGDPKGVIDVLRVLQSSIHEMKSLSPSASFINIGAPKLLISFINPSDVQLTEASSRVIAELLYFPNQFEDLFLSSNIIQAFSAAISSGYIDKYMLNCIFSLIDYSSAAEEDILSQIQMDELFKAVKNSRSDLYDKFVTILAAIARRPIGGDQIRFMAKVVSEIYEGSWVLSYNSSLQLLISLVKMQGFDLSLMSEFNLALFIVDIISNYDSASTNEKQDQIAINACLMLSYLVEKKLVPNEFELERLEQIIMSSRSPRAISIALDSHRVFLSAFPEKAEECLQRELHINFAQLFGKATFCEKVAVSLWFGQMYSTMNYSQILKVLDDVGLSIVDAALSLEDSDVSRSMVFALSQILHEFEMYGHREAIASYASGTLDVSKIFALVSHEDKKLAAMAAVVSSDLQKFANIQPSYRGEDETQS